MNKPLLATLALLTSIGTAWGAPTTFDFKDPKGVNAIRFHLDSLLEPISGTASGVSGTVVFDAANPSSTKGKISVATKSLVVPNATMTEHLLSPGWLASEAHPEITFELFELVDVKTTGAETSAKAKGKLTLKGVSKDITVPVKLTLLPNAFGKRMNKPELPGDLLVIRGDFSILRADFGIQPGKNEDKVSTEIKLSLGIVGGPARS